MNTKRLPLSIFSKFITVLLIQLSYLSPLAFGISDENSSELTDLLTVKSRIIEHTLGNKTGGELWTNAVHLADEKTAEKLTTPFSPERWEDPEDDQVGKRLSERAIDVRLLAQSYVNPASQFYHKKALFHRIEQELRNILEHFNPETPRPGNWYYWLLQNPNHLGMIGLLLENELPTDLKEKLLTSLRHELKELRLDGSNAAQEARNHIYLALLDEDTTRIQRAAEHALKTLTYSPQSGIQEDYSYLFHGRIPYGGGYGADFARDAAEFMYYLNGTRWTASAKKREIFVNYLLEHIRWFIVGHMQDLHVSGRGYRSFRTVHRWFGGMLLMTQVDNSRQDELEATVAALLNDGVVPSPDLAVIAATIDRTKAALPSGFRFWYEAEMGVYKNKQFHVSFRQYSDRVQDYEYLTLTGKDGWNLAYGFTNILRDGAEWYQNKPNQMLDTIDMVHLPGTTARIGAEPENPNTNIGDAGFSLNFGTSPFSGGTGWEEGGVAGFILEPVYGDFSAQKSVHFFPLGFWALGTNIQSKPQSRFCHLPIHTTVFQWVSPKPLILSEHPPVLDDPKESTERTFENIRWFHLDGLGGVFAEPTTIQVRRRDGVVTIWIDHGTSVKNGHYAYAILPVASLEQTQAFANELPVQPILTNPNIHIVRDPSRNAESFVFFEAGAYEDLSVNQPLVLYRKQTDNGAVLALQNPLHNGQQIQIEGKFPGNSTFLDPEITIESLDQSRKKITLTPTLGRIYRAGFGPDGARVQSSPREDLSAFRQFIVTQESTAEKTIFTVQLPQEAIDSGYNLSLRAQKGHLIKYLKEADAIERPSANTFCYEWIRPNPELYSSSEAMSQSNGDFRFYLETPTCITVAYVTIPVFDSEGNIDLKKQGPKDRNQPPRSSH